MKHYAFVAMMIAGAIGSLMSMDYNHHSCLTLSLNKDYFIKGYSAQDMNYKIDASSFLGKKFFDAIISTKDYQTIFDMGFLKANQQKRTVNIAYGSDNAYFLAAITPMIKKSKKMVIKNSYIVTIKELDNQ